MQALKILKHLIGCVGVAIVVDYFLFNGFCTQALSQASSQIHLDQLKDFSPSQFIGRFF
jgi:hypothetical protein